MEFERKWNAYQLAENERFNQLNGREQAAIRMALSGIEIWEQIGVTPEPMKVRIATTTPFDFVKFEDTLHNLGVGIRPLIPETPFSYTFQPVPYFSDKIDVATRQRTVELIQNDPNTPQDKLDFFEKFQL